MMINCKKSISFEKLNSISNPIRFKVLSELQFESQFQ